VNYPAPEKSTGKAIDRESAITPKYPGFNENVWRNRGRSLTEADQDTDWKPECFIATSSLDPQRFIHIGPFSKPDEIERQRFGDNPNDNWWLWETRERVSHQVKHEFLSPVKQHDRPIDYR
jgi:hypothetical protein